MLQCPCLYLACDGETSILIFKERKRKYQSPRLSWNEWPAVPQMTGSAGGKGHSCQCRRDERSWFDPWFRKIPWRRACNPLQYSCLQNSMDRGPRKAIDHSVTESWTWLKWLNAHAHTHIQTNSGNAHSTPIVSNIYFLFPTLPLIPSLGKMPLGLQFYAAGLNTDSFNSICSVHYWPPLTPYTREKMTRTFIAPTMLYWIHLITYLASLVEYTCLLGMNHVFALSPSCHQAFSALNGWMSGWLNFWLK